MDEFVHAVTGLCGELIAFLEETATTDAQRNKAVAARTRLDGLKAKLNAPAEETKAEEPATESESAADSAAEGEEPGGDAAGDESGPAAQPTEEAAQ